MHISNHWLCFEFASSFIIRENNESSIRHLYPGTYLQIYRTKNFGKVNHVYVLSYPQIIIEAKFKLD